MALREEMTRSGTWLFRWRSYVPLAFLALVLVSLREFHYLGNSELLDHIWEAICLSVSTLGLVVRVLTIGFTPKNTSGRNKSRQVADSLNTDGIYSLVRNPLYLGNFLMGLGVALFAHLWWLVVIYTLFFWLYYERIIYAEEEFLREKFGQRYLDWAAKTPAIVPRFRHYRKASLSFSLRNVLRREYNGFFAMIVVLFSIEIAGELIAYHRLDTDEEWLWLLAFGFLIWITLWILKRYTRLLEVEGR